MVLAAAACSGRPQGPSAPGCPAGPVTIARQADVAALARCTRLAGVTVRSGAPLALGPLAGLAVIDGDLVIGPTVALDDVELRGLRAVGGALRVTGNGVAQRVVLPALTRAASVEVEGNPVVTTIALPRLAEVVGALRVADDASLELLDLAALARVGALALAGVPRLTTLDVAPGLVAGAVACDAPGLAPEVVAQLAAAAAR
jgi:hypothetical protein